jgi:hypothetical protein
MSQRSRAPELAWHAVITPSVKGSSCHSLLLDGRLGPVRSFGSHGYLPPSLPSLQAEMQPQGPERRPRPRAAFTPASTPARCLQSWYFPPRAYPMTAVEQPGSISQNADNNRLADFLLCRPPSDAVLFVSLTHPGLVRTHHSHCHARIRLTQRRGIATGTCWYDPAKSASGSTAKDSAGLRKL